MSARNSLLLVVALSTALSARAAEPTRRFAVVAGAREGGPGRVPLRYATSDAKEVSEVLRVLGGVAGEDVTLLENPTPADLRGALARVPEQAKAIRARGGRSELFLYYSGHSDADGLLLGSARLSYADLRAELDRAPAEVRVAILDSCASGAFTRSKGGVHRPPFLLDSSSRLRGHAFLTSSAADEASQESDRLKASFFTHALLTGMRGAADANGDSRVTLNEAYQFAFQETLAQTESTRAGPQHATYDIGLVGSGDVVLTDLRLAGATLVVPEALEGRVFVRDESGLLVAELRKVKGTAVELALPEGGYQVRIARGSRVEAGTFQVPGSGRVVVVASALTPVEAEANAVRGEAGEPGTAGAAPEPKELFLDLALFPPLSLNDVAGRPRRNTLALGLVVGYSDRLEGVAVGAAAHGAGAMKGVQVGGAAVWVNEASLGVQVAGATSIAAGPFKGVQVSGAFNWAGTLRGAQVSTVNAAGDVNGLQVGVVNVGKRVSGMQVGIVNVADEADAPIGLVNWVRDGRRHLEVFATETATLNVALRTGGRWVHGILTAGVDAREVDGRTRWTAGGGLGGHLDLAETLSIDVDLLASSVHYGTDDLETAPLLVTFRPTIAWRFAPRFALFAAPSLNYFSSTDGPHDDVGTGLSWDLSTGTEDSRLFVGFAAGLRL